MSMFEFTIEELDRMERICAAVHDRDWRLADYGDRESRVYLAERYEHDGEDDGSVIEVNPMRPEAKEITRFCVAFDPSTVQLLIAQVKRSLK